MNMRNNSSKIPVHNEKQMFFKMIQAIHIIIMYVLIYHIKEPFSGHLFIYLYNIFIAHYS